MNYPYKGKEGLSTDPPFLVSSYKPQTYLPIRKSKGIKIPRPIVSLNSRSIDSRDPYFEIEASEPSPCGFVIGRTDQGKVCFDEGRLLV